MTKPIILTGLRANNDLTLGNYFGGMLPIIDMAQQKSDEYQINMFIPDLHSFTTPIKHELLYSQIIQTAKLFAAAGLPLDNDSIYLYRQSYVPAHSELTWILDCFTYTGELARMTQFKDKSNLDESKLLLLKKEQNKLLTLSTSVGLYNYPVLMAADILLYGAKYVPVGDDQTQHLEFTRDIAERMNSKFGELFVVPEAVKKQHEFFGNDQGLRIMDLVDPTRKMSKSATSDKGVIFLSDTPDEAAKKIMGATTDDKAFVAYDPLEQPGISNLLQISALLSGKELEAVIEKHAGQERYGDFKKEVAEQVKSFLVHFQEQLKQVDEAAVMSKLESSEKAMNEQANATLYRVQQAVGLRPKA
ncbi:MAG TPA: tryptophan--tRNA ligase [Candidatus Saccharibacteria bacterium]|nr:tryptophan--tRNA ligase [Candidatus Saccharibacteria bacterium]HRK94276.1 tryptophan--tRNA ligase [Candidatus Saccharibacteria bacterium]